MIDDFLRVTIGKGLVPRLLLQVLQQQPRRVDVAVLAGDAQRRLAVATRLVDRGAAVQEQRRVLREHLQPLELGRPAEATRRWRWRSEGGEESEVHSLQRKGNVLGARGS